MKRLLIIAALLAGVGGLTACEDSNRHCTSYYPQVVGKTVIMQCAHWEEAVA